MFYERLSPRDRSFILVSYLVHSQKVFELLDYLPTQLKKDADIAWRELIEQKTKIPQERLLQELKELSSPQGISPLGDIHPDWIIDYLHKESPKIIGTILRYLPAEKASYILDQLPQEILNQLPTLNETFGLDRGLTNRLKTIFENDLLHPFENVISQLKVKSFDQIYSLKAKSLFHLIQEIGFRELSLAFTTLNEKTISLILHRLPKKYAERLKMKINQKSKLSPNRLKQAQSNVLSLNLGTNRDQNIIFEAGFFVFSRAVEKKHLPYIKLIKMKFSLQEGNSLQNYIDKNIKINTERTAKKYQKEIEKMLDIMFMDL